MPIRLPGRTAEFETLPALLGARAQTHPEVAFEVTGRAVSFAALDRATNRLARALIARGVAKGDRIAILLPNGVEQLLLWFAAAKVGAIVAPLNHELRSADLAHTLTNVDPKMIVSDASGFEGIASTGLAIECQVVRVLAGPQPVAGDYLRFEELDGGSDEPVDCQLSPGDPVCIIFTGGTTGLPKGVLLPHFYYIAAGYRWADAFKVTAADHHYSVLQFYHIGIQSNAVVAPLLSGYGSTIDRWFSLSNYWRRVRETGATLIDPMGSMFTLLEQQPPSPLDRQHRVRAAWAATAMLPQGVAERFAARFGIELVPVFGGTEIGGSAVVHTPFGTTGRRGTCGRAHGWCEIRAVDERDQALPPGVVGQIAVRPTIAFSMMSGYYNAPQRTIECWRNLWFHTGDLGSIDGDGYLTFVGRQVHWLRRRSENISAYEVESVLVQHPAIAEAIVVGVASELGEDEVKAFVRLKQGDRLAPQAVCDWCADRLARFKVPRYVQFVDDFPRSAAKKEIERHKLKALGNEAAWDRERTGRAS